MALSGVVNDVTHIHMQEFFNAGDLGESLELLKLFGFGGTLEEANANMAVAMLSDSYLIQPIHYAAEKLGFTIDRIDRRPQHQVTSAEIVTPAMVIPAGTVGLISYVWTAYVNGKPFYTTEAFWYVGDAMRPAEASGDDFWTITIEGRPSLRMTVEAKGSIANDEKSVPGEATTPGYLLTVIAMLRSVPLVERAPPGIMLPKMPELHWQFGPLR